MLNPEHEITMLFRNVGNCRHNDTAQRPWRTEASPR